MTASLILLLSLEHLEHFMPEQIFQVLGFGFRTNHKTAIAVETTVDGDQVKMWIKSLKITKRMNRDGGAGHNIIERDRLL
jgi:hypothetical protein